MEGSSKSSGKHFILVHGLSHGAWCWYKMVAMLRSAGHRASALDLAASGAHQAHMDEVPSYEDYSRPLLHAEPGGERLVLVGHGLGGLRRRNVEEEARVTVDPNPMRTPRYVTVNPPRKRSEAKKPVSNIA